MATTAFPPPYFITADDKRGLIVVTAALVLAFVWTCSLIRTWLRWQTRDCKIDDWFLVLATLSYTVQSSIILSLVHLGLGTSRENIPRSQLEQLGKEGIASQIFYICTLLLSKYSVLFLYLRLSPGGAHRITSYAIIAASLVWAILAAILIVVPCNPAQYVINPKGCTNGWPKWQAISSLDIVTEVFIFGIAIQLVWALHMSLKAKIFVILAFSTRLPVIAFASLRLYYLHIHFLDTSPTAEYIVVTQWQMGYAIMSSTFTSLGPFLRPFDQGMRTTSYQNTSRYGNVSAHVPEKHHNSTIHSKPQRNSWQSEGYLMQSIPSRRGSKNTLPDSCVQDGSSATQIASASTTQANPYSTSPHTAGPDFRPLNAGSSAETKIWVGDRSTSFGAEDAGSHDRTMIISKRTHVKIEVDGTSSVI